MRKTTLFIDFDDTLVDYTQSEIGGLRKLCNLVGIDEGKVSELINTYQEKNNDLWKQFQDGEIEISEIKSIRFKHIIDHYQEFSNYGPLDLNSIYLRYFIESTVLDNQIKETLSELRKYFNIIIVSNGIHDIQKKRMFKVGLFDLIDGFVTSEEAGAAKPQPHMFSLAHEKIEQIIERDVSKDEILMIGDSYSADVIGAKNYEIDVCWITEELDKMESNFIFPTFIDASKMLLNDN